MLWLLPIVGNGTGFLLLRICTTSLGLYSAISVKPHDPYCNVIYRDYDLKVSSPDNSQYFQYVYFQALEPRLVYQHNNQRPDGKSDACIDSCKPSKIPRNTLYVHRLISRKILICRVQLNKPVDPRCWFDIWNSV